MNQSGNMGWCYPHRGLGERERTCLGPGPLLVVILPLLPRGGACEMCRRSHEGLEIAVGNCVQNAEKTIFDLPCSVEETFGALCNMISIRQVFHDRKQDIGQKERQTPDPVISDVCCAGKSIQQIFPVWDLLGSFSQKRHKGHRMRKGRQDPVDINLCPIGMKRTRACAHEQAGGDHGDEDVFTVLIKGF